MLVVGVGIIAGVVYVEQAQRRIPVQYAKRMVGRRMYGGTSTYIPLKVNMAGVIPVIFASSLLYVPTADRPARRAAQDSAGRSGCSRTSSAATEPLYLLTYALLIIFFTYFYVAITFNPVEVADNMKQYGGFVPGIRAGKPTAEYLDYVLTRITLPGSIYLAIIAIIPFIAFAFLGVGQRFIFGGTSLLIMVGVGLDTVKQIESPAAAAQLRRVPPLMRVVLMGPPGAGKGTQAVVRGRSASASRTSRPATSSAPTSPGGTAARASRRRSYMDAGEYVPDSVTNAMVRDRLAQPDAAGGFLLDGYPRTLAQVDELAGMLAEHGARARPGRRAHRRPRRGRRPPGQARRRAGSQRRHRGRHPPPPGDLRRADRAAHRASTPSRACSCRSTAWARSTRSPPACSSALGA